MELLLHNQLVNLEHNNSLRTFHVGGTASRSEVASSIVVKKDGKLEIEDLRTVNSIDKEGKSVEIVVSRAAETKVIDSKGDVSTASIIPYGSTIYKRWKC